MVLQPQLTTDEARPQKCMGDHKVDLLCCRQQFWNYEPQHNNPYKEYLTRLLHCSRGCSGRGGCGG